MDRAIGHGRVFRPFVDYLRDLQIFHHNVAPVLKELLAEEGIAVGLPSLKVSAA